MAVIRAIIFLLEVPLFPCSMKMPHCGQVGKNAESGGIRLQTASPTPQLLGRNPASEAGEVSLKSLLLWTRSRLDETWS
jgi:hypothetical protein